MNTFSKYKAGSYDDCLWLYEEAISNGQISEEHVLTQIIEQNGFSQSAVAQLLDDGYLRQYIDRLKSGGWLAQDYTIPGDTPVSETPAENTSSAQQSQYTEEEIAAAWSETSREEATCTKTGSNYIHLYNV